MQLINGKLKTVFNGSIIEISPPKLLSFTESNLKHAKDEILELDSIFDIEHFLFNNIIVKVEVLEDL